MSTQKVKFPIRLKLMLGNTLILTLGIGLFLTYTLSTFINDKQESIFGSGLSYVESIKIQINERVNGVVEQVLPLTYIQEANPSDFKKIFKNQNGISSLHIVNMDGGSKAKSYYKSQELEAISTSGFESFLAKDLPLTKKLFVRSGKKYFDFPNLLIGFKNDQTNKVYMAVLDLSFLAKISSKNTFFKTFFWDKSGLDYVSGKKELKYYFQNIQKESAFTGTKKISSNSGNEAYLVSFAKIKSLNILVAAVVEEKKAFGIVRYFLKRSIGFGFFILGISMFITIFLSINITGPLKKLLIETKIISEGDFEHFEPVESADEVGVLSDSVGMMADEIVDLFAKKEEVIDDLVVAEAELKKYSENLEELVDERTFELKESNDFIGAMVNSLDQGLFVIDSKGLCHKTFTHSCQTLFGIDLADKYLWDVFGVDPGTDQETLQKWVDTVFMEMLRFEDMAALGQKKLVKTIEGGEVHLSLEYFALRDDKDKLKNIVIVVTDMTAEVKSKLAFDKKESEVTMILKIIESEKQFYKFIAENKMIIERLYKTLGTEPVNLESVKIDLHTLKGGFGIYKVQPMIETLHELENSLDGSTEITIETYQNIREKVKEGLYNFLFEASKIVGQDLTSDEDQTMVKYSAVEIQDFSDFIESHDKNEISFEYTERFLKTKLSDSFKPFASLLSELALKLNKNVAPLEYEHLDMRIDETKFAEFFGSLVHLFRNIADHAIESPSQRELIGKIGPGRVRVDAKMQSDKFVVSISDDGKGIDADMIRKKITQDELPIAISANDEEMVYAIFDSRFSSANEVTDLSGRGVGMAAIKDVVNRSGGKVILQTKVNAGTIFTFELPTS